MLIRVGKYGLIIPLLSLFCIQGRSQSTDSKSPWKGYAILGNGHVAAVYSDDSRISALTHGEGIQHLYFKDYTADYIATTSFHLLKQKSSSWKPSSAPIVGMKNFFTTQTQTSLSNGISQTVLCFVHPEDAVVLSLRENGASASGQFQFRALLRKEIKTDRAITLTSFRELDNAAIAEWSNGMVLAIASKSRGDKITIGDDVAISIDGDLGGEKSHAEILLMPASSQAEALSRIQLFRLKRDLEADASRYWNSWMDTGRLPLFKSSDIQAAEYLEAYKRNLYCVKSADLNGQIPADITGQFVTNGMPQLYPRDAMMCARVLLLTGHAEEAKQVIEFWGKSQIPMKTPGEWYARYDAHGKAVDAGSGARFDEPEWDANGYYIYLLNEYHRVKGVWLADSKVIYELADFLVSHVSANGLLREGGIVEWTGDLPATNMICAAALRTAGNIARDRGERKKADAYVSAAQRISAALPQMFDVTRQTYGDLRFTGVKGANGESLGVQSGEKLYLWDTTANVGLIWGYPNHREIELSNIFYAKNTVKLGGGMQYFDSPDPGLASYGHGVFFFTTAAAAQYESLYGKNSTAKGFIDWMIRNANSYGLMPEHILPDGSDCSPASPLSWCSAEFAAALLLWSQS
jgi:GH15 family glucan-1,4-alpha-glucosidase